MAFQEMPISRSEDDPTATVGKLLSVTEALHRSASSVIQTPRLIRVARSNDEEASASSSLTHQPPPLLNHYDDLFGTLLHHLRLVRERLVKLKDLHEEVQDELCSQVRPLENLCRNMERFSFLPTKGMQRDVEDITRKITDLVGKIPPLPDKLRRRPRLLDSEGDYEHINNGKGIENLPDLQEIAKELTMLEAFRQVEDKFMELEIERKMCLLSFAVFPENREVHRTMLMYWWIGEGIFPVQGAEETVSEVLKEFTENKLVEPVEERRKVGPSSYKMTPFVHSSVIHLSQKIGLFDIYHKGGKPSMNLSKMGKVCLLEGSSKQPEAAPHKMVNVDHIETVFNVSERYPEFTFKWFSEHQPGRKKYFTIRLLKRTFKSLRVFYLGRWERKKKRHIHVQLPELMKSLKTMTNLRLLSFQGISSFRSLKSSICSKLRRLIVLDLRECSDLTRLPEKIDSLRSLVYLDMTGCYMLEWIPMRLALLHNLEVLKGFVVSDTTYQQSVSCPLYFLKHLKKLRKLSIDIHRDDLGVHQLMVDILKLRPLTKLKVTWRRDLNIIRADKPEDFANFEISLPRQLKKLDLQRFPHEQLPTWLLPHNLLYLKKLYIGGGRNLRGFGDLPKKATQCSVENLRLTSLPRLRVGWIELKNLYFPNLTFLENYKCPRVFLTPCDGNGIWRSDQDE